jgi:hypothetical protein
MQLLNHALRMRWQWLSKTDTDKPWQGLEFSLHEVAEQMFRSCTSFQVGKGDRFNFWTDRWIHGSSVEDLAPNLMEFVSPGSRQLTVAQALSEDRWIAQFRGALSIPAIAEFVELWETLSTVSLSMAEDKVTWKLTANGSYSASSVYHAFFLGRTDMMAAEELWSAGAPLVHKLHAWFALHDRLWTADRLERRGLDHPSQCVLCCQEPKTGAHIAINCSFSRQVWYFLLLELRLHRFTPSVVDDFATWWSHLSNAVARRDRKELNALVLLVTRSLWLKRNSHVFDKFATMPLELV